MNTTLLLIVKYNTIFLDRKKVDNMYKNKAMNAMYLNENKYDKENIIPNKYENTVIY
jgi:hypothetical protein